mmetsp:Transcript_85482/g.242359  ORF Transcript_85482/g.242359 Transcript_85482/m.242359 type:complete len:206 (+) Transcript_85482:90-707(+)|eukprot:CAMPEP_0168425496 /NCGR_PEP_ID=MMETSP0228-20121227/35353_1 /TAXON_ID=133427 /ORGANISM="Protoceratium reticulatum, Strain CCCM 535 (=CCMP 1889)" /LENGTH=205 /DNA_ID=CAMNT_0008439489 /DNA_START=90 /DNA_END=707 /DNA_ORIENTATION=+
METGDDYTPDGPLAREIAATVPYFPYKGIERFYDIGGLLRYPALFDRACGAMAARCRTLGVTCLGGFDARGFLFTPVAIKLGVPFFMLRKGGKMPCTITSGGYTTEYDQKDGLCIQRHAVRPGDRVALIDDLIATGGTLCAGIELVKALGGEVVECTCLVELKVLKGAEKVRAAGAGSVWALVSEEVLTLRGELPEDYVDDGCPH